ncbi:MAG: alanine dehydrogenase [Syntrophales bacterium]|nr:alanine dehydrogenase [Syntrophales bacterium]MCK9528218.1 alanine dehydrogenase [Syntrophales bacterium]MDX9921366.1 alanine dehydrogenase [Syntrophales bacterium]
MIVGVLRETKEGEHRFAMTPAGVRALKSDGHRILLERDGGEGSGISNDEFTREGAEITDADSIYTDAELIVKVKEPLKEERFRYRRGQMLFTFLHLASSETLTDDVLASGVTGIAYETVEEPGGRLPLLTPMSEVAGRMSIQMAMRFLEKGSGGRGVLLSGVPGVAPGEVVIIGCGTVGLNAARIASELGAHVTVLDTSYERLKHVDQLLHGKVITLYSNPYTIEQATGYADVLIAAVLVTGTRAPVLVTEDMVSRMKKGSVIIDVSVDQGGTVETIRPTTHDNPVYHLHGVLHCGVTNIPASVPSTSTFALGNATISYIRAIAEKGLYGAAIENEAIARGINCVDGIITHEAVAKTFGREWLPWDRVLRN